MTADDFAALEKLREENRKLKARLQKRGADSLAGRIKALLAKSRKSWSLEQLSDTLDSAIGPIRDALDELHAQGVRIDLRGGEIELGRDAAPPKPPTRIDTAKFRGLPIKFGLTADNHLCSRYARMDVLNALFDIWEEQGITEVYQCGNMIDGEARFNKHDLVAYGLEEQVRYFVENWPQRKGIVTRFVTGDDHEGWYTQREGVDVGRIIELYAQQAGRNDLVYLGHMEHDIIFAAKKGVATMRVKHPGGGATYATSYTVQKEVESYQGGEKPNILLAGHFHKAEYGYPREVHCVQAACTQDQTPFLRKKRIQAHVGGWTVSFEQDENGLIHRFLPEFHPFFDRDFYSRWRYHWRSKAG